MARVCGKTLWALVFVCLFTGCTNLQFAGRSPFKSNLNLKPEAAPEVLSTPPKEARYSRSQFPEVAFRDMNDRYSRPLDGSGGIIRAQGMSASPGSAPPGMGSRGMGGIR